ncbi:hypothetical protein [Streptomyces sp. NPDC006739]|uniref:SCO2400 family protein n=1 Tax=Streptomyces sp. NPDC006739 TaxID=3364763 RepID=UPI0036BABF96
MDYCSSCRRHLNGALVCPGCGAYAPDIAPVTAGDRTVAAPVATATDWTVRQPDWGLAPEPTVPEAAVPEAAVPETAWHDDPPRDDVQGVPAAPQGRAARRRQLARWKKNQRRAVVATAVALVGGGLTVVGMDRQSAGRPQAAAAPEVPSTPDVEQPTSQHTGPALTGADAHPSTSRTRSQAPATNAPLEQSFPAQRHTSLTTATTGRTAQTALTARTGQSAHTGRTTTTASGASGAGQSVTSPAPAQSTPPAAGTSGNTSGTNTGTPPSQSQSSPSPAATSPSQLCLLVVCLG